MMSLHSYSTQEYIKKRVHKNQAVGIQKLNMFSIRMVQKFRVEEWFRFNKTGLQPVSQPVEHPPFGFQNCQQNS